MTFDAKINRSLKVVFIPTPVENPVTGGEIYNFKLFQFLLRRLRYVESVEIGILRMSAKKTFEKLFFGLTSIIRNFFYIYEVLRTKNNQKTVILEDVYYSTDLFLFNFIIRRIKKNVSIVPIVHHLYCVFLRDRFLMNLYRTIEVLFLLEADWIIVNSKVTESSVKRLLKETKEILVAYPGLDKEKMVGSKIGYTENKQLKILSVGSVTERKDFETLLRAVKILVDQCNETNFFVNVIGDLNKDKHCSAKILEIARALSLSNHVAFRGRVDGSKLCNFYARSDIFVSTSLYEGFGMALVEAMYNHLPIVAMDCGAIPELVRDGLDGFLIPPGDHKQLAEKIKVLMQSEELREKMGEQAFRKVKKFDWDRSFNKIYEKLVEVR